MIAELASHLYRAYAQGMALPHEVWFCLATMYHHRDISGKEMEHCMGF